MTLPLGEFQVPRYIYLRFSWNGFLKSWIVEPRKKPATGTGGLLEFSHRD